MSKGAKQALFVALAAVVIVAVMFAVYSGKSASTTSTTGQGFQTQQQTVDPAIVQRIQNLENEIRAGSKDVQKLTELGQLYLDAGDLDKAGVAFAAAIDIEPNNSQLHTYLGLAYFWTGRSPEAIAEYRKAIEVDPKAAEAYYSLALALSHSQPSDTPGAIEAWKKVIELAPDTPFATKSQEYIGKYSGATPQAATAPALSQPKP